MADNDGDVIDDADSESAPETTPDAVTLEGDAPSDSAHSSVRARLIFLNGDNKDVPLDRIPSLMREGSNLVWVDLSEYEELELRTLVTRLGLPSAVLRAALAPWQRPYLTAYSEYFFLSATVPRLEPGAYHVLAGELDVIVGRSLLVSAHKHALPFMPQLDARLAQGAVSTTGFTKTEVAVEAPAIPEATFLAYLMLDELLAYYEDLGARVEDELEMLEEQALHAPSEDFLKRLLLFKRYVFALYRLAEQHRAVFAVFLRPDFAWVSGADAEAPFEDLEERLARLLDVLGAAKEATNGAFDLYVSHMAHRTNQVIKVLTLASTLLFTASVVIALFGATLQGVTSNGPLGFEAMLAALAIVSVIVILLFRRRGWI